MTRLALLYLVAAVGLGGQPETQPAEMPDVKQRLEDLEAASGLDEAAKTQIGDLYRSAQEALRQANQSRESGKEFLRKTSDAPGELERIRAELAKPADSPKPIVPEGATLAQMEQLSSQASAELAAARKQLDELQTEATKRQERRTTIPEALANARQRVSAIEESLTALSEGPPLNPEEARRVEALAKRAAAEAEAAMLEAELASYDARRELLPARRDRAQRRIGELDKLVSAWQSLVSARRQQEADKAAQEAERLRRQAARQHEVLQEFASESQQLAELRTKDDGIPKRIGHVSEQISDARTRLAKIRQDYLPVKRRLEASGLTRATGLLLRRQYESLPDVEELQRRVSQTQKELVEAEYTLIERQEQRAEAGDIDRVVGELLAQIEPARLAQNREDLEQAARDLAVARRGLLDDLVTDSEQYFERLFELDEALRSQFQAVRAYEKYIGERIFWVRSVAGEALPTVDDARSAIGWLISPSSWVTAGRESLYEAMNRFGASLGYAALLIGLIVVRHWSRRRLATLAKHVGSYRSDSFEHTLRALVQTLIASAPWPLLFWVAGWLLVIPRNQPEVALGVGAGLQAAAMLLIPLSVLREILRPNGLATAHFRWQATTIRPLRRHLRWLVPIVVPATVLVVAIDRQGDETANASLGRLAFTVGLVALAVFAQRIFRPSGAMMGEVLRRHKGGWLDRLRYVWYPLIVGAPLALVVLAWMGYHFTATQLEARVEASLALVLVLVIVNAILMRWLFLARRSVAVEEAKRRRQQAIADAKSKKKEGGEEVPMDTVAPPIDEDKLDLPAISAQTTQLFRTTIVVSLVLGLYLIWSGVLPALRMFDRVEIWPNPGIRQVEQSVSIPELEGALASGPTQPAPQSAPAESAAPSNGASNGSSATPVLPGMPLASSSGGATEEASGEDKPLAVTLADVGLSIIVLIATVIGFRNVPGLVDMLVLQRLPLDSGSRFALSTVIRYGIAMVGVAVAFGAMGIGWSNVQWLAAALTFGLAFGLQEIFANFVSGLIILAERPIRIGDTVTIGSVTGTVTRIRMRATTISDWDRKELVIPNKTFITGEVINWTLSDPVMRVIIPVGVGYGENIEQAESILLKVAREHELVLKDPKPSVLFKSFGDSTLDFELRVFIGHIDHLVPIKHAMHMRITKAFREAKIEIAFPQRDLHIRSIGELSKLVEGRRASDELASVEPA